MSLISLAPWHLGSRVYDTFQCTGRNDMLSAGDLLLATFLSTRDRHFMEKIKFSEVGWKEWLEILHMNQKNLNHSRWQGRCEAVPGPLQNLDEKSNHKAKCITLAGAGRLPRIKGEGLKVGGNGVKILFYFNF